MPENDKTGTKEENFSIHCVQDVQKDGRQEFEMFQEALLSAVLV